MRVFSDAPSRVMQRHLLDDTLYMGVLHLALAMRLLDGRQVKLTAASHFRGVRLLRDCHQIFPVDAVSRLSGGLCSARSGGAAPLEEVRYSSGPPRQITRCKCEAPHIHCLLAFWLSCNSCSA